MKKRKKLSAREKAYLARNVVPFFKSGKRPPKKQIGSGRKRFKGQRGGIFPFLAALIPAAIAASKAAALGGISAGVGYGVKKGLEKA